MRPIHASVSLWLLCAACGDSGTTTSATLGTSSVGTDTGEPGTTTDSSESTATTAGTNTTNSPTTTGHTSAASTDTTPSSTTGTGSSTTAPPGTCDDLGDCTQCNACSVGDTCAAAVEACLATPQCQPYQQCMAACPEGDLACPGICEQTYPDGYTAAWAQFDCAVCLACPASCPTAQAYCQAGGGGPHNECTVHADCVELHDSLPYCVGNRCVECLTDDDCLFDAITCANNFCV